MTHEMLGVACRLFRTEILGLCQAPWYRSDIFSVENIMLFSSTLIGAIVGAVVAGVIQYKISRQQFEAEAAVTEKQRLEVERAKAFKITFQLQSIMNSQRDLEHAIAESFTEAAAAGLGGWPSCLKVKPISGLPQGSERFEAEDMYILVAAGNPVVSNAASLLANRWSSMIEVVKDFNRSREEMSSDPDLFASAQMHGLDWISPEARERWEGKVITLSRYLESFHSALKTDIAEGEKIAADLGKTLKAYFKDPNFPTLQGGQLLAPDRLPRS
ncbi:hypothetical protein HFO88_22860 [Rhizobium leguminosarum]|uniref:Transmembrane protein n=1 Tax=Rhizobium leguminosarum bv. viciae TaxID=387 RepID=A0A7G6RJI1_RHILV|nr:hypothetical protein [Rhizobium leguminosarum]MBY5903171.1 hypothetical protein [Rhizobium leguminosarum]MBY5910214.1 hypothetical protein [Rhizobium leguminosarum]NKK93935.1 hypothetical protein [Rhizobium leguminosarum bv. viciae]QND42413.1 hypothetical protein HB770_11835 [Rhizobium leguminosarum bv. viciae]